MIGYILKSIAIHLKEDVSAVALSLRNIKTEPWQSVWKRNHDRFYEVGHISMTMETEPWQFPWNRVLNLFNGTEAMTISVENETMIISIETEP